MDVKAVADNMMDACFLAFVGALVSTFAFWIKDALAKWRALYEWKRNPHAHVGARMLEWRDAANRQVIVDCQVMEARLGRVMLRSTGMGTDLVLTIREFQAGHALWDVREDVAL